MEEYICKYCGRTFKKRGNYKTHYKACQKKYKDLQKWISEKHTCEKCGKIMVEKFHSGRFCSYSCANSRNHSEETRKKISDGVINYNILKGKTPVKIRPKKLCKDCGSVLNNKNRSGYCVSCVKNHLTNDTKLKLQDAGKKSAASQNRRSKNEIAFCELCEKNFLCVKHNEPMFNGWDADYIVEWNMAL